MEAYTYTLGVHTYLLREAAKKSSFNKSAFLASYKYFLTVPNSR